MILPTPANPSVDRGFARHSAALADTKIWQREYECTRSIPSSTRTTPSKALQQADLPVARGTVVADIGCGNGRNAVYFASLGCYVIAVDSSPAALARATDLARTHGLEHLITLRLASAGAWPRELPQPSLVIDSYVSCHALTDDDLIAYWHELAAIGGPGATFYTSQFTFADDFYSRHIESYGDVTRTATDPLNLITKRLYAPNYFVALIERSLGLTCQYTAITEFNDTVADSSFKRSILSSVFVKE